MRQKNYKTIISIIISILIISLSTIYILRNNIQDESNHWKAKEGVIDLSNCDYIYDTIIKLDGEWEFYPNVLLTPEEDFDEYENIKKYVDTPSSWEPYLNDDGSVDGSGTYRLKINLPDDDIYGIKNRTIRYSSRIYLDDEEVIKVGNPSTNSSEYEANSIYKIGLKESTNKQLDLIVQASSFGYTSGGMVDSIEFGTYKAIMNQDRFDRGIDAVRISAFLIIGLFFLFTYYQRKTTKELIYFSAASISIGIYVSTLDEQLLNSIINYDHIRRIQIQMLTLMIIIPCILRFTYHMFKEYGNKKVVNIITALAMLSLFIAFLTVDGRVISIEFSQYFVLSTTLACFIYIFNILIKAIIKHDESSEYIIVIIASLFTFWIGMMLNVLFEMDTKYLSFMIIFILLTTINLLMSDRLHMDHINVKSLSQKLKKDDELKDEFLARVSHELETPLQVIRKSSHSLIEGEKGVLNPDQQESLYFISQEGKRLLSLVSDLLDASQIKMGKINVNRRPVNIYIIIKSILREKNTLIPDDKDIVIINQVAEDFPLVLGDQERIIQIVYNLIDNAIKFSEDGDIVVSSNIKDGQALLKVKDSGIGIKAENKEVIFDNFYKDTNYDNQGLGIGLPITKHLVEIQGGQISVESDYGKGTSIMFSLPLYEGEETRDEIVSIVEVDNQVKVVENQVYDINRPTILIADDIKASQSLMTNILPDSQYNLIFAEDGKTTLEIIDNNKIDLVVLDYFLPDMSSNDVSKKIREKFSMTELPIIVLTASGRTVDLEESFASGVNDYIRKSADKGEFVSRIKSLLAMKESVREGLTKEFQYFYSQISPHFLYNTINTIIGLSYKDVKKARKALTNLAIYFRGKLEVYKEETLISLESELELVTAYLEIEEMRHEDRLKVEIDIDEDINTMIPPLTLQPLVENSIRHGIMPKGEGSVKILAKNQEGLVIIRVEDDGVGISVDKQKKLLSEKNDRLGFKNVMNKIKIVKGANLQLDSKEGSGTRITITLPGVKKYASNISR